MPLIFIREDIVRMQVDAIVCPTDHCLSGSGGLDRTIREAAGPALAEECRLLDCCPVGEARLTGAGNLPCKHVIHTVGPVWKGGGFGEAEQLAACYNSALRLAGEAGCESLAIPLIASGTFRYPRELALRTARSAIEAFLQQQEMTVYLVVYDRLSFAISEALFSDVTAYIDDHYAARPRRWDAPEDGDSLAWSSSWDATEDGDFAGREAFFPCSTCPAEEEAIGSVFSADAAAKPLAAVPKAKARKKAALQPSLAEQLQSLDAGFSETLLRLIDERGMTDAACYKKANIDRKLFSKIRSDRNYRPSKPTVIAFAVALELNLADTKELLQKAGFALSRSNKFDVIIQYFIEAGNYDLFEINQTLFQFDQSLLGG